MQELHSTKLFDNLPCAHRQWTDEGNCKLIHGYSRSFLFTFACQTQNRSGFVVDFGDLKWLKAWLEYTFDHTLLLSPDDPHVETFQRLDEQGVCALRIMPYGVSMEGSAQYVCAVTDEELRKRTKGRAWVVSVEARENNKNSAIYHNPDAGFKGWAP